MPSDADWGEFQRVVTEGLLPKLEDSAVCISLAPPADFDAKVAVELGAMILLDKPILVIAGPGRPVSNKLRLVADEVIEGDLMNPADTERIQSAIVAFSERYGDDEA